MSSREERLAQNEVMFREVNERIVELTDTWPGELDLICECANKNCHAVLPLARQTYEELRREPRRFVVVPGHELPDIEDVVERRDTYLIVEKHPEMLVQAEETDPRP